MARGAVAVNNPVLTVAGLRCLDDDFTLIFHTVTTAHSQLFGIAHIVAIDHNLILYGFNLNGCVFVSFHSYTNLLLIL